MTDAKRAFAAKKIGEAVFAAAMHELDTRRTQRVAEQQRRLKERKLSQRAYQKEIEAIVGY